MPAILCAGILFSVVWIRCGSTGNKAAENDRLVLPAWVTDPVYLDSSNPFSSQKAALGRYLFYDRRLSVNQTKSCASCHAQSFSFTDGYRRSIGALGDNVPYNTPPLINLVYNKYLTWTDSTLHYPEQQVRNPMHHSNPVELGWEGHEKEILDRLRKDSFYTAGFAHLYQAGNVSITEKHVQDCISSFVKTITSCRSPYDKFLQTCDSSQLSAEARRGMRLFFAGPWNCNGCHGGINLNSPASRIFYYGENDSLRFRVPTLRNLRYTAPYWHDGSVNSLEEVLDKHVGRLPAKSAPSAQSKLLSPGQRSDLVLFLYALSDSSVLSNPAFANPFMGDETKPLRPGIALQVGY